MKLFKKIRAYIQAKIDKYVVKRFVAILPRDLITSLYKQIAERDLVITTKEVQVKKGKRKYTLLVAKDNDCTTVFNLGRHEENEEEYSPVGRWNGEFTHKTIAEMQRKQRAALVHVTMANGEQVDISTKDMPEGYSFEKGV